MAQEYLLEFLKVGVIDLNGDDSKLEKLRDTAKDLAAVLRKSPSKTSQFTMVAADPSIAAADPSIVEAMDALRQRWQTISNTHKGLPVAILRAILLDAIVQAARADDAIAVAFVNTARNALAHAQVANEAEIWRQAVSEIETKVDERAEAEWTTPEKLSVPSMDYTPTSPEGRSVEKLDVDLETLKERITAATNPNGGTNPNPYWVHQSPQQWGTSFAERLAMALAQPINTMAASLAAAPVDLSGPLSDLAEAVAGHVNKALASFSDATAGLQRRTNLLWWKEAMYSPSSHASYLDLPPFDAAALMALDLHEQVPTYSPASVSALLRQTINALPSVEGNREFEHLVRDAAGSTAMGPFRTLAATYAPTPAGRGPLLSLLGYPREATTIEAAALREYAGVDATTTMSPSEWGTYLFRELQAARAISPTKRSKKK
jgi:hypothetical protein